MKYRHILLSALLGASSLALAAGPVAPGAPGLWDRAVTMYQTGNYTGAIDQLRQYLGLAPQTPEVESDCRAAAELLMMRAMLARGEFRALESTYATFAAAHAGSPLMTPARLLLGDSYFYQRRYGDAVAVYSELPLQTGGDRFRYAVSLTRIGQYRTAEQQFRELTDDPAFGRQARFYVAYLDYVQGDYASAYRKFRALDPATAAEMGADFYIGQILFKDGKYSEVLAMGPQILQAASLLDAPELPAQAEADRIIGESAYALGSLQNARAHLKSHLNRAGANAAPTAQYLLGVMAYDEGDFATAAEMLAPVTAEENHYGQGANLYLGQIAARRGDYTSAAMNFERAAQMAYDAEMAETALYNYAGAVAAGGRVPFGSSSLLLEQFGQQYPNSKYAATVDQYLALGYLAEKRYVKALEKLDKIKRPSAEVNALKLQTLYELGTQELSAGRPSEAEYYLRRATEMGGHGEVATQSWLWLGEALYAQKKYDGAISAFRKYTEAAPKNDVNLGQGYYDMAYAYYQKGDYRQCRATLDKALKVSGKGALSASLKSDARLRKADCDNYLGNLREALAGYRQAAESGAGADYAALQAACMEGLQGNYARKKADLEAMMAQWPDSPWRQQALYELSQACLAEGDMTGAENALERLRREAPKSQLLREGTLQLAAACIAKGQDSKAVELCKDLIRNYPSSAQAVTAGEYLQQIYTERGDLSEYLSFIQSVPGAPAPKADEMDRLTYLTAATALEKNPADVAAMEQYIRQFPNGRYMPDALLSVANAYVDSRNSDKALTALDTLLGKYSSSNAALPALALKAQILEAQGRNDVAASYYYDLLQQGGADYAAEAYEGLMNTAQSPEEAIAYADKYLSLRGLTDSERDHATTLKADALIKAGRSAEALTLLKTLASDTYTPEGGAAVVKMADIYLAAGQPKEAERLMLAFTDSGCADADQLAWGYIALAKAYAAQGQKSLARQYLNALKENYPGDNQQIKSTILSNLNTMKK